MFVYGSVCLPKGAHFTLEMLKLRYMRMVLSVECLLPGSGHKGPHACLHEEEGRGPGLLDIVQVRSDLVLGSLKNKDNVSIAILL